MTYRNALRATVATAALGLAAPAAAEPPGEGAWTTPEYRAGWQLGAVGAAEAYKAGYTGRGVTVGVVDSGLDTRHPEFSGRVLPGYDFVNDRPIGAIANFDIDGHGTHVGGIIAAARDGAGMHGVAFDALLQPVIPDIESTDPDAIFAASWRLLADQGVPIVNNSIGINDCAEAVDPPCNVSDYKPGQFERERPDTVAALRHAAETGVLMVFATGNEAQPAPDILAGMPVFVPELRDNWLAVGAVDADNTLAPFSNRCGVAAKWCLVAPGVDDYSTMPLGDGTSPDKNYMPESGTSMAAPVVSGIAALVKEAFPFFTARDLQQTLLTTATDMGNPDAFGWGMVDAGKAVKGYGQFTADVLLDTAGFDAVFGNDIGGAGSLSKLGAGTLTMTGANTYSGGTAVLDGVLSLQGSLRSAVVVGPDGTLSGDGTIDAPLAVAGVLAPGNSPGTLSVSGPVTLGKTATARFSIEGTDAGSYSRLVVRDTVSVGGILVPVLRDVAGDGADAYAAALGDRFDVLRAERGVKGSFSRLAQPGGGLDGATRFDAVYEADGVALVVTPQDLGDLGANGLDAGPNEEAVGVVLEAVRPAAGSRGDPLFSGLYATAPDDLAAALGKLSGEIHASAATMEIERAGMLRDAIGERVRHDAAASGAGERATFWSSSYGGWGRADGDGAALFRWNTANALFGADAPVGDSARLGVAGGFGRSEGDIGSHDATVDATHFDLAAYAGAAFGGFEASVAASHGWSDLDTGRRPTFGTFRNTLTADYDRGLTQAFGELGYRAQAGRLVLNPFLSGAYLHLADAGVDENGGVGALSGAVESRSLGVSVAGVRALADFDLGNGTLSTVAALGWQRIGGDRQGHADLAFAEDDFTVEGAAPDRDALRIDLGGEYTLGARAKAGLSYRGAIGGDSVSSSVRGNLGVSF